ncbi:cytochrome B5-like heme steroid binding domain-containing protein [Colletotrichum tofieldiae]|nr:cytochrome B5-like heme steroid binding domain-containing protein [Colletotrichum tofieldiae]
MGYIGVSLILASVVWVMVAPPPWMHPFMPPFLLTWHHAKPPPALPPSQRPKSPSPGGEATKQNGHASEPSAKEHHPRDAPPPPTLNLPEDPVEAPAPAPPKPVQDRAAMPPPPPPVIRRSSPIPAPSPPLSSLDPFCDCIGARERKYAPSAGTVIKHQHDAAAPRPPRSGPPRLAAFPALDSPQRARGPVPNRGPSAGSYLGSSLAPPPTHSAKAPKPSRKVILTPGHSPLDWARISGPNADLRNLPTDTPYLKVTPSTLKKMTGRKGKDAWMALGGRVYNITPYLPYHPAGVPELLRGAGRDGTKLFGEIHPWVNYETMLSACLVGLLVEEDEGSKPSAMDEMD